MKATQAQIEQAVKTIIEKNDLPENVSEFMIEAFGKKEVSVDTLNRKINFDGKAYERRNVKITEGCDARREKFWLQNETISVNLTEKEVNFIIEEAVAPEGGIGWLSDIQTVIMYKLTAGQGLTDEEIKDIEDEVGYFKDE